MKFLWTVGGVSIPVIIVLIYPKPWVAAIMIIVANVVGFIEGRNRR